MGKHARLPALGRAPEAADAEVRRIPRAQTRYYAFLSYSHKDKDLAEWLHRELERFRVPRSLAGKLTANGVVPKRLTPIFRDQHDLAATGDLGGEIKATLGASQFLVVLCSPTAAVSRWTNAEIEWFKQSRPEACVLAAIAAGEPFASEMPGREDEECFPPALRYKYDRRGHPTAKRAEPLAADFRESGEGRRTAFLKLVAGMLGIGLDELVQRDQTRRHRQLAWLSAASLAGMAVTSTLAVTAIQARDEARDQRREAEGLVGFMLGDLKDKLEPIGRLDVLDALGAKALAYYEKQNKAKLSDASLAQRSKALTLMGQIASDRGDLNSALRLYKEAFASTAELLRRQPGDAQRIFDHAQNVFYVGDVARHREDERTAEWAMHEYKRLATRLIETDPTNPKWQMEGIYADTNLGTLLVDNGRYSEAAAVFENSLADREKLAAGAPENAEYKQALVSSLAWLGEAREKEGRLEDGLAARERQLALLQPYLDDPKSDTHFRRDAIVAYRAAGRLNVIRGNVSRGFEQLRAGIRVGESLLQTEPQNTDWAAMTAWGKFELARFDLAQRNTAEPSSLTGSFCDMADRLAARDPTVVDWRLGLRSACLEMKTRIALANGAPPEAQDLADQMVRLAGGEVARSPSNNARLALAYAQMMRGLVARAGGSAGAAAAAFQSAAAAWPTSEPDRPSLMSRKVVILKGLGRRDRGEALASKLDRIGYRDPIYLHDRALVGS
jgi:tetratricopeptide (TPR) repeat protein